MERSVCASIFILFWTLCTLFVMQSEAGMGAGWKRTDDDEHSQHMNHDETSGGPGRKSIVCYHCNSEYDPNCGDPFNPYTLGTVNCSLRPKPEHLAANVTSTICRKTTQKVYGKTRVIRECGYITDPRDDRECFKRTGTHDVHVLYCACTASLCNGAPRGRAPAAPAAAAATALALLALTARA